MSHNSDKCLLYKKVALKLKLAVKVYQSGYIWIKSFMCKAQNYREAEDERQEIEMWICGPLGLTYESERRGKLRTRDDLPAGKSHHHLWSFAHLQAIHCVCVFKYQCFTT